MTAMRSPINRSLLSFRFGVFVLFLVESFICIILSGGNLVHKAASPVSVNYNLLLVVKSVVAFMWMTVIVAQDLAHIKLGLVSTVWCELTWLAIFCVTELGGGIVLLQESLHPGSFCYLIRAPSAWNICHATVVMSGSALLTGLLLTAYLCILGSISIYHAKKYPVFHLLCSVREFNWFPAAGSDQVKMSYDPTIESIPSADHVRDVSRSSPRNMVDLERQAPLTISRPVQPPSYSSSQAHEARRAATKPRPPPLKLITSNSPYSAPVIAAPISFVVEPQRVLYPQRPLANTHQLPHNGRGHQFGANYI